MNRGVEREALHLTSVGYMDDARNIPTVNNNILANHQVDRMMSAFHLPSAFVCPNLTVFYRLVLISICIDVHIDLLEIGSIPVLVLHLSVLKETVCTRWTSY